jgi:hypothetical protein
MDFVKIEIELAEGVSFVVVVVNGNCTDFAVELWG